MLKRTRHHRLVLACAAIGACADFGPLDLDLGACWMECGWTGVTSFAVSPTSANIVRGDTLTLRAFECDGGLTCGSQGNVWSRWSITGDAAAAVVPSGVTRSVPMAQEILVRGIEVGRSDVRAVAARDSTQAGTIPVIVADSSVITEVRILTYVHPDSLRLSARSYVIHSELRDAIGTIYRTQPGEWTVSDSTVARLAWDRLFDGTPIRIIAPVSPGTVEVTARFLQLSASLRLTVVP